VSSLLYLECTAILTYLTYLINLTNTLKLLEICFNALHPIILLGGACHFQNLASLHPAAAITKIRLKRPEVWSTTTLGFLHHDNVLTYISLVLRDHFAKNLTHIVPR